MTKLTKKMREVLRSADLDHGEINSVPLGTMYGLEARKLISSAWRRGGGGGAIQTTAGDLAKPLLPIPATCLISWLAISDGVTLHSDPSKTRSKE